MENPQRNFSEVYFVKKSKKELFFSTKMSSAQIWSQGQFFGTNILVGEEANEKNGREACACMEPGLRFTQETPCGKQGVVSTVEGPHAVTGHRDFFKPFWVMGHSHSPAKSRGHIRFLPVNF